MARIDFDKYYTPVDLAKSCIDKVFSLGLDISEVVEPSAGNGSFSLQIEGCKAYDLVPEHPSIIRQDFLKLDIPYKKGRLFIGNPPFGRNSTLIRKFLVKAASLGDYIAFVLPVSFYQNKDSFYEFDLISSEELPLVMYSGVKVDCCFNVYVRPLNGKFNKKTKHQKSCLVEVIDYRRGASKQKSDVWDYGISGFGASAGKPIKTIDDYCHSYLFKINDVENKQFILDVLSNTNWRTISTDNKTRQPFNKRTLETYLYEKFSHLEQSNGTLFNQ